MSITRVQKELLDGGLHEPSVRRLLDHYQSMQTRLKEEEYDEAGTHIGNFCENMVNILRYQMGEPIQNRPNLGTFVDQCTSGNLGMSEPDSIRLQIARTLRAAYDIRSNRDSVHVNLTVPVNHADTQVGIAMCSWMLAEILRVYGASSDTDDMAEVGELIEEISEPVTDGNPLQEIETSQDDFDRERLLEALEGKVQVVKETGQIQPRGDFSRLSSRDKFVSLMLGRQAASDLGHLDEVGAQSSWFAELSSVSDGRIRQLAGDIGFVRKDSGGYYIPQYRILEAVEYLEDE